MSWARRRCFLDRMRSGSMTRRERCFHFIFVPPLHHISQRQRCMLSREKGKKQKLFLLSVESKTLKVWYENLSFAWTWLSTFDMKIFLNEYSLYKIHSIYTVIPHHCPLFMCLFSKISVYQGKCGSNVGTYHQKKDDENLQ